MPDQQQEQQQDGGFLGGLFSNPLVAIGGLLLGLLAFAPNLISGIMSAIGSLFSGLMGGNQEQNQSQAASNPLGGLLKMFGMGGAETQPQAPVVPSPTVNTIQPVSNVTQSAVVPPAQQGGGFMDMLSGMWNQMKGGLQSLNTTVTTAIANAPATFARVMAGVTGKITNDTSKAHWCAVNGKGEVLAGNAIDEKGDNASITKMLSVRLAASDSKLPQGFMQRSDVQTCIKEMAHRSSNEDADLLLKKVAEASNRTPAQVIEEYNGMLKQMGAQSTEIANFSGLPAASDGGIFIKGHKNVGTARENAIWTQQFGALSPELAALFAPKDNVTGMCDVNALAVKTGTACGIINPGSGATKSAVAYDGAKGSIAVIESTVGEWKPTINKALAVVENQGGFPVQHSSGVVAAQTGHAKQKPAQLAMK